MTVFLISPDHSIEVTILIQTVANDETASGRDDNFCKSTWDVQNN